ncbi:MAG: DUF3175 domain-containing protein [Bacteroidetes bacterium]|nr:DUF3175 domain-containing protein [Bacteroidota bacterium]
MPKQKLRKNRTRKQHSRKWSGKVTQTSGALDLEKSVFKKDDPAAIARSLKRSATKSHRRKGTRYQSAMSMLNFYINRAGKNLPEHQKKILEDAKEELKKAFGRE